MLRKRNLLICVVAVVICFMGIKPVEACDNLNLLDGGSSMWELIWEWLTSLFGSGAAAPGAEIPYRQELDLLPGFDLWNSPEEAT